MLEQAAPLAQLPSRQPHRRNDERAVVWTSKEQEVTDESRLQARRWIEAPTPIGPG